MPTLKFSPNYNFYQLLPGIFLLKVDGNADLAHSFLRVQEFYESVNDDIRGKAFTLNQYKDWYCTQSENKTFSYGEDWKGFNVPSSVIEECYTLNKERTLEDVFFLSICEKAKHLANEQGLNSYYLLGVRKGDTKVLQHEIAHGLFSTNAEYRKIMTNKIQEVDSSVMEWLYNDLKELGYGPNVYIDEAQAYLSTGLRKNQKNPDLMALAPSFAKIFDDFLKDWTLPKPIEEVVTVKENIFSVIFNKCFALAKN